MKIESVLVVCVGNICRSPLGERLLQAELDKRGAQISVTSAGLHAVVGHPADTETFAVAAKRGVSLDGHQARRFTNDMGRDHDLILVMEPAHRIEIARTSPALSGKVFLFDQWSGAKGIADPYRRSKDFHEAVFLLIHDGAQDWAAKLAPSVITSGPAGQTN
ncbi:low molecular weight protein-tyrosine-phosphatase [Pararhodobacter zhoushanensis]|uniref:low molecular weight protein-tyrosine-phosphatase n=1 Tax=Pararhodobacter zhoushanensis TaxID=2479545 RepID=UPI000F8DB6EE|nr:low molecular weight protein-tyrosine-phosphatase [Pararhodobacter zhoushanensis]